MDECKPLNTGNDELYDCTTVIEVGRCRLNLSNPTLKASMV